MSWQAAIERTVAGLGYELVECERAPQGLLRVTIDRVPGQAYDTGPGEAITVDDCERVTRQLQFALQAEPLDYARLEVSSPGLDRLLRKPEDFRRFAGLAVDLTLRVPLEGRKRFRGELRAPEAQASDRTWALVFADGKAMKVLDFNLDEVREVRLVPVVDFKRRRPSSGGQADVAQAQETSPNEP